MLNNEHPSTTNPNSIKFPKTLIPILKLCSTPVNPLPFTSLVVNSMALVLSMIQDLLFFNPNSPCYKTRWSPTSLETRGTTRILAGVGMLVPFVSQWCRGKNFGWAYWGLHLKESWGRTMVVVLTSKKLSWISFVFVGCRDTPKDQLSQLLKIENGSFC